MKSLLVLFFVFSSFAVSAGCVDSKGQDIFSEPDKFLALISKASSCYSAKSLAEKCAYGSSLDVATAGNAYDVCSAEMNKRGVTEEQNAILTLMKSQCTKKYSKMAGTMYRSINAFCHLEAVSFINNLSGSDE